MIRFLVRWIGTTGLAVLCSAVVAVSVGFPYDGASDRLFYLQSVVVLFFSALSAIGQGWVMLHLLKRPILWGVSTGSGTILAAATIAAAVSTPDRLWWPIIWRLAFWIRKVFDLSATPWILTEYVISGWAFGLVLGATQAAALGLGWRVNMRWIAISTVGGVLGAIWIYAIEIDTVANALWWMAESIPMQRGWRVVLLATSVLLVLGFCYALPTGLLMQRLLRRYQHTNAEALVQRFE
jgi:hypothetical protein